MTREPRVRTEPGLWDAQPMPAAYKHMDYDATYSADDFATIALGHLEPRCRYESSGAGAPDVRRRWSATVAHCS